MPELKIGKVSLNTGQSGRSIYPFTNTEGLVAASKRAERQRIRAHAEEMAEMYEAPSIVVSAEYRGAARAIRELLRWLDEEAP